MNILLVSTHLNTGGITSYLFTLTKGLVKRGHSVHVATSGGNMENEFLSAGAKLINLNIRTKSELDPRIYLALKPLKDTIEKNDINIIHGQTRITQVMGSLLQRATGRPFVSTCHGFFKARLSRKWAPCWGEAVIAISSAVERHLAEDFAVARQKIHLIESGVDTDEFVPVDGTLKQELRNRFNLGNDPTLGMIARLSDVKGPDILIESMKYVCAHIRNARLLLVGEGRMEKGLRAMVDRLGLMDHVRFFSIVNKTNEMLSLLDIFVMPSRQEGLGLSIMEAQAAGVPVIASRVGGIPSLIKDGVTGILVEPENPVALAKAIIKLFEDKNRMSAIGKAGRVFIQRNYSADRMIDKTVKLYESLLT